MLQRRALIPQRIGGVKCPAIHDYLNNQQYGNAARAIINSNIPFSQAYLFLSNSPEAVAEYFLILIKEIYAQDPTRKTVVCNLYVNFQVPYILSKPKDEHKKYKDAFLSFVTTYKPFIEKHSLYIIEKECCFYDLLRESYLIFEDYLDYLKIYFETADYDKISTDEYKRLARIMDLLQPMERALVLKIFPTRFFRFVFKYWRKFDKKPEAGALYPVLCDILFADPIDTELVSYLQPVLSKMYRGKYGGLATLAERNLYYMLLARTNNQTMMDDFYMSGKFLTMPHDFLLRWLKRNQEEVLASLMTAHVPDMHHYSVSYALIAAEREQSVRPLMDLLTSQLSQAEDRRDCWLRALEKSAPMKKPGKNGGDDEFGWKTLLETATTSYVLTLDDIFPLMPPDMNIDSFQGTILNSIKQYQEDNVRSNERISQFVARAAQQREVVSRGNQLVVELEPIATCHICKQSVYKDRFLVFPCMHAVHVKCFLSNMHLYFRPTMRLSLISLAARAAKDEGQRDKLAAIIRKSCPVCGELSINVLDKDFVLKEEKEEREMWSLE